MPDNKYNVDDILREFWREHPQEPPAPKPAPPSGAGSLWEDDAEGSLPPVRQERAASRPITPPRPLWDEEDEEPPRPARASRPSARKTTPAETPPSRPITPPRPLWDEEDEEPPRPARASRPRAGTPPAETPPSRPITPPRPLWDEEDEEPFRPSRPAEPKVTPRQAARSQALWEAEDAQPPRQSSPAMSRAEMGGRQEIPSLSQWEERYEPAKPEKTQRQEAPARPLWEEGRAAQPPENAARTTGRSINAAAAAQLLTGGEDEPKRARRGRDEDEGEERPRARRRREEEDDEEDRPRPRRRRREEDEEERPRVNVGAQLRGMKNGLILRLVVNLLCAAGVIYLMLAPGQELPIPEYFMEHPGHYLWLEVGLAALSALVSGNTMGGGVISLFCLRPNNDSYTAVGVFACLVQGAYIAMRPEMMTSYAANLYLPMAALLLLFNTVGKLILRARVAGSYRLIAREGAGPKHTAAVIDDPELAGRIGGEMTDDDPEIAYFTRSAGVLGFLEQAFSESKAEDISRVIAPMTAVAALVMALISYPFHGDVFTSACVFTAALCITAPIAGVIVTELPIALINRRLSRWGATFCGYSAMEQFSGVNQLLLRGYNLFPPESVTLHTIKPFNRAPQDQVMVDAASVLSQCDSTLTQFILEKIPDQSMLRETESFVCEDGKGVSAWVEGRRVLVGNRELMKSYGVSIPPPEYEEQYGQGKQILYIANSGQAAAMYVLSYKGDRQMRRALELLADLDIAVCVYTVDPNITADRISQVYNFPRELVKVIPAALHQEVDQYLAPKGKTRAGMIHNGEPSSYVRGVAAARSCDNALTLETALLLLSVVVGFALVTFFAFTGGMPALTWVTIAAYQAFWSVVQLLVAFFKSS